MKSMQTSVRALYVLENTNEIVKILKHFKKLQSSKFPNVQDSSVRSPISDCRSAANKKQIKNNKTTNNKTKTENSKNN